MADWRLSAQAAAELAATYSYTHRTFGEVQAEAYVEGLHRTSGLIADFPGIGTSAGEIKTGYRRSRFQSHFIFYTAGPGNLLIRALIHVRRNARKELFESPAP